MQNLICRMEMPVSCAQSLSTLLGSYNGRLSLLIQEDTEQNVTRMLPALCEDLESHMHFGSVMALAGIVGSIAVML